MKHSMLVLAALLFATPSRAGDWVTWRSFYTHRTETGNRVQQYSKPPESQVPQDSSFQTSGFTHIRSSLNFGQSADNYHRVQQWGTDVRPYGEWRFPYRPYSAPYPMWGEPYGGLNIGGFGGYPYPPYPPMPHVQGGVGGVAPGIAQPPGPPNPWQPQPGGNPHWPWNNGNLYPSGPYPSGPGQPYPAPPYADGYYPDYGAQPTLRDSQFFEKPTP